LIYQISNNGVYEYLNTEEEATARITQLHNDFMEAEVPVRFTVNKVMIGGDNTTTWSTADLNVDDGDCAYAVFNQNTGMHEMLDTRESAIARRNQLIESFQLAHLPQLAIPMESMPTELIAGQPITHIKAF